MTWHEESGECFARIIIRDFWGVEGELVCEGRGQRNTTCIEREGFVLGADVFCYCGWPTLMGEGCETRNREV